MERGKRMTGARLFPGLSERDRTCFECPLPECREGSAGCLFQRYEGDTSGRRDWRWLREQICEAEGPLTVSFSDTHTAELARCAVLKGAVRTRMERAGDGSVMLYIEKRM